MTLNFFSLNWFAFCNKNKNVFFRLECEFRHLSLAEYLTALHIHVTGDSLLGFPKDRKELILQYLSGLASSASTRDQTVVRDFLAGIGSHETKDALVYLKQVQKMKGEWYNQQGKLVLPTLVFFLQMSN